jgi:ABC-type glycerol-3-phosphate transport system substrate-binding protein
MKENLSRRQFLSRVLAVSGGLAAASLVGAGCAPKTTPEPAAPEKEAPTAPAQPPPAKVDEVITLRVQMEGGQLGEQMGILLDQWNERNDKVKAVVEETVYGEIAMKTELGFATGDLPDSLFAFTRWHWLGAYKGWYLALDDLLDAGLVNDYEDFYEIGVENQKFEGKVYGLIDSVHVGPASTITWNRGLFEEAGLEPPNPDMTMMDLHDLARKVARPEEGIFGIQMALHTPGRFVNNTRAWGKPDYHAQGDTSTWITSVDGKEYNLLDNPGAKEILTTWLKPLLDEQIHPMPEDQVTGGLFIAGKVAMLQAHQGQPMRTRASVGDNWEFHTQDCMILPVGPEGRRGTSWECHNRCVYAKTKYPQEALQLNDYLTSYEAGMISLGITGNRSGRKSVISDPKWQADFPIYQAMDEVLTSGIVEPYPMPWNLRDVEATDTHKNLVNPMVDGQMPWETQAPTAQREMQSLFDLPRP